MKPFPNRTGIFQRIRLSLTSELSSDSEHHLGTPRAFFSEVTRDYGPSPCERCYRLPGWTLLHRLLRPLCPSPRLVTQPTHPSFPREVAVRFRRSSHSNLPADLGLLPIPLLGGTKLEIYPRDLRRPRDPTTRNQNHQSQGETIEITLSCFAHLPHHLVSLGVLMERISDSTITV